MIFYPDARLISFRYQHLLTIIVTCRDLSLQFPDLNGAAGISDYKFRGDIDLTFKFSFT